MKGGIHPDYVASVVTCTSCTSTLHTHATMPEMRIDLCSNCHPFYTGKQRIVDTAGRVERFNQRRTAGEKAAKEVKAATRKREKAATAGVVVPARVESEMVDAPAEAVTADAVTSEA